VNGKCQNCHRPFPYSRHLPKQKFCNRKPCQNARKNDWRKRKLEGDEAYRGNQRDAQKRWLGKNPGYWRSYREHHPPYVEVNRRKQRERNRKRISQKLPPVIAKSDASFVINAWNSGYYMLLPVSSEGIAKSDASLVKISAVSETYAHGP
jgi:hypothetical protein